MALSNLNGILLSDLSAFDGISSISAVNGITATLGTDVTAPTLSSATVAANGTTLTLVFSEAVSQGAGYADADLNLDASTTGADLSLTYVSGDGTNTWVYTIGATIQSGETVDLDFNGDADSIEDGAGNDLAAIVSGSVTNNSTQGGSAAWVDTVAAGSLTAGYVAAPNETFGSRNIVATISGNVTAVRAYNYAGTSSFLKIGLYDTSWNRLTVGQTNGPNGVGWVEVPVTPYAVTASTAYRVVAISGANDLSFGYQSGQPATATYYDFGTYTYSGGLPDPASALGGTSTDLFALGMYIEP